MYCMLKLKRNTWHRMVQNWMKVYEITLFYITDVTFVHGPWSLGDSVTWLVLILTVMSDISMF